MFSLLILLSLAVQRISPPNKPRVQLQICMNDDDQATFVFMKQGAQQEELLKDRDLVRETLQQALVQHRQIMSQVSLLFLCSCGYSLFRMTQKQKKMAIANSKLRKRRSKKMHISIHFMFI